MDPSEEAGAVCALCGEGVVEQKDMACGLCAAPHHQDCFEYTGICSAYGCGGLALVPYSRALVPIELTIDESTRAPLALGAWTGAISRRLARRRGDLIRTVAAGFVGGALACTGMAAWMVHMFGVDALTVAGPLARLVWGYGTAIMLCGILHGLLSPFVAPIQHRYPARTMVVAGAVSLGAWLAGGWYSGPLFLITAIAGIVTTWSAAEWLAGDFSPAGRWLGRLARPARFLIAAGIFLISSMLACMAVGIPLATWLLADLGLWTMLATVAGGPSVEVGKEEYRKHLIALVEGRGEGEVST